MLLDLLLVCLRNDKLTKPGCLQGVNTEGDRAHVFLAQPVSALRQPQRDPMIFITCLMHLIMSR